MLFKLITYVDINSHCLLAVALFVLIDVGVVPFDVPDLSPQ